MNPVMLAAAALLTQFQVLVTAPDGKTTRYQDTPTEVVRIAMPEGSKYACQREAIATNDKGQIGVAISCIGEGGKGGFTLGAVCETEQEDSQISALQLKDENMSLIVACRTKRKGTYL